MKLRYKIALLVYALALTIGIVTTYWAAHLMGDTLQERFKDEGSFIAHSLSETLVMPVLAEQVVPVFDTLRKVVADNKQIDYLFITDFDHNLFAHSFEGGFPAVLIPKLSSHVPGEEIFRYRSDQGTILHISQPLIEGMDARLHIGLNDNSTQTAIDRLEHSLGLIAAIILLLAIIIGALLSRRITQPLGQLTHLIQRYGQGEAIDLDDPRFQRGSDEIAALYNAFKEMVGERDKSVALLRRSKANLAEAQQIANIGNWNWEIQTGTLDWSDEIYRIFGHPPQAFTATYEGFLKSVHPDDHALVTEAVNRALASDDEPYSLDHRIILPDGQIRIVHEQARVFRDESNAAIRMLGTVQDITSRKLAEEELAQYRSHLETLVEKRTTTLKQREEELRTLTTHLQASNQELEAFSYSVSHDLRAPLRAIDGFSLALLEDYQDRLDETGHDYLQRIRKGAQKMSRLIDNLLQLSRISRSELKLTDIDLSQLATQVVEELRRGEPTRKIDVTIEPDIQVRGDATLLGVLLSNLIGNAWKFTQRCDQARIEIGRQREREKEVIFIRDNGAGFDMKYADKLFSAFQRLHSLDQFDGTGVGLATVQRVINRHGGRVWTKAAVGRGATFYFTLPGR